MLCRVSRVAVSYLQLKEAKPTAAAAARVAFIGTFVRRIRVTLPLEVGQCVVGDVIQSYAAVNLPLRQLIVEIFVATRTRRAC